MDTDQSETAVSFASFRLYPTARLLERDGAAVHIGGRALDILIFLTERAGEVISKKDLMARVWSNVSVDEGSLRFHIAALRKALGDGTSGARYVTNVAGRGYSLVVPVSRSAREAPSTASTPAPVRLNALPARMARMVGRDETVQAIAEALSAHRFVTIVGPGGIGKTTVATAAGHALSSAFQDKVSFVDLGPLTEPRLVPGAVASALGLAVGSDDPIGTLIDHVREARLLLILDGCEHLVETIAVLAEMLFKAAPSVGIIVTSRESLRVEGEYVHRLFPLSCPPQGEALSASDVLGFPAARLFIERVTSVAGKFELSDAEAPALADICHRLDGIPLAIELAAARADAFGIKELAAVLDDRLLLTTRGRRTAIPRHQTLKATLDWSYERLPQPVQLLLNRLSVFSGAFTMAAASSVCPGGSLSSADIPAGVADLVTKSLVTANPGAEAPFRLLDTTRAYAREQLVQSGESEALAERHARYVCALFQSGTKQWEERPSLGWLATYRPQIDNLRAALGWAFSEKGDPSLGITLTIAAVPLWSQLSLVDESLAWVESALSHSATMLDSNPRDEMQLHAALGGLQMYSTSSMKQASDAWLTALTLATELEEADYQLRAVRALWAAAINSGEFRKALTLAERFKDLALQTANTDEEIVSDRLIGTALHFLGEHGKAHDAIERMLERYVASVARSQVVRYQFNQQVSARLVRGRVLWMRGQTKSALRDIEENVSEALNLGHTMSLCNVLTQSACPVALLSGDFETTQHYIDLLREHTTPRALDIWHIYAICFEAGLDLERGSVERGLDHLQPAMEQLRRIGFGHYRTSFLMMRARGLARLDRAAEASAALTEAIEICERTGERWCLPEIYRLVGETALGSKSPNGIEPAVDAFHHALVLARQQHALAWELRAGMSLVRCLAGDSRIEHARMLLRQTCAQFAEGLDSPELLAAASLLEPAAATSKRGTRGSGAKAGPTKAT